MRPRAFACTCARARMYLRTCARRSGCMVLILLKINTILPSYHLDGKPSYHLDGKPSYHLDGIPSYHLDGIPSYHLVGIPSYHLDGIPSYHLDGIPSYHLDGIPSYHLDGIPSKNYIFEHLRTFWRFFKILHICGSRYISKSFLILS